MLARAICFLLITAAAQVEAAEYLPVVGGAFKSVIDETRVAPFAMRSQPVTVAEYLNFVHGNPPWSQAEAATALVGKSYLVGQSELSAPVTQVSWFAASAYCESEGARLPRWYEWELTAAADESRTDAREDEQWLTRILAWYAKPGNQSLPAVAQNPPNVYGLFDLHGLIWEWVEDAGALLVNADARNSGTQKQLAFCGGSAISLRDKRNYAVLMRLALLGAMEYAHSGPNLGFRCARDMKTNDEMRRKGEK